jgi:site-specific DNA-methyltransferase (adenine-specific)
LPTLHAVELAPLAVPERAELAEAIARDHLTIKSLRRIIADKQREVALRTPEPPVQIPLVDQIPPSCQAEVGDARHLPLDDASVHLVITSPPYNARVNYANYVDWLPWDDYWYGLIEPALREAYRVLCSGGRLALNLPNVVRQDVSVHSRDDITYASNSGRKWKPAGANGRPWAALVEAHLYPLAAAIGFLPRERIQWIKGADPETVTTPSTAWGTWASATNPVLRAVGEPIYIFSKERYDRPDVGESDITPEDFKRDTRNVWFVPAVGLDPTSFPASFPIELPRRLIRLYSFVGDLVVDPFMGSGTTLIAAAKAGRWAYGCDISQRYVDLTRTRLAQDLP